MNSSTTTAVPTMRCMRALGLYRIGDDVPVESTYYEFRRRLAVYSSEHGMDLVGEAFRCAVRGQIKAHNIKGEKIRMDSKLIQSDIAKTGRLELVLETVRVSTADLDLGLLSGVLDKTDFENLVCYAHFHPARVVHFDRLIHTKLLL